MRRTRGFAPGASPRAVPFQACGPRPIMTAARSIRSRWTKDRWLGESARRIQSGGTVSKALATHSRGCIASLNGRQLEMASLLRRLPAGLINGVTESDC